MGELGTLPEPDATAEKGPLLPRWLNEDRELEVGNDELGRGAEDEVATLGVDEPDPVAEERTARRERSLMGSAGERDEREHAPRRRDERRVLGERECGGGRRWSVLDGIRCWS